MESRLITIEDWRESYFTDADFSLLWFGAEYPTSFLGFGYPRQHNSYNNWLLKDLETGEFDSVWAPSRWSHACFAYDHGTSFVRLVKVVFNLNNN